VRRLLCVMTILGVGLAGAVVAAGPAWAATAITNPAAEPFTVPGTAGSPNPFTITATGFTAGSNIFVEQCDRVAPTTVGWDPSVNCDLGSSPAAATADGTGAVTFDSADLNHAFHPFKGASPQGIFNCLSLNDPSPNNGLPDFRTCKIRVSTNNSMATADQVFRTLVLPDDPGTPPPPPLRIGIGNVGVLEGASGTRAATFTVSLSRTSAAPVTVDFATVAGTATAGSDFTARTGTLTIPAGSTSGIIAIQVKGDTTTEPNETFKVHLTNATGGAGIKRGNGTATILNDDPPKPGIRVGVGNAAVLEGNSSSRSLRFTVSISEKTTKVVKVHYATSGGTATAGTDYTAASGTATIPVGKTAVTFNVKVKGDTTAEPTETFQVKLTSPTNATISRPTGTGSILDDD